MKLKKLLILIISVVTGTSTFAQQGQAVDKADPSSGNSESRSNPSKPGPFTFVQICDPQLGMGGYEHDLKTFKQAVIQANALKPDFVVICGDLVARLDEKSVKDFNRIKTGFTIPTHCVPGNHDVFNDHQDKRNGINHAQSLANYRKAMGKDYYSFEHKGQVFLCANSQLWKVALKGESEKHDQWVKQTLATASKKGLPVFVVMHHPLYTDTLDEKDAYSNLPTAKRKELLELFEKHGVVAVLTGHEHKVIIREHKGIQLVTGETTSKTHGSPLGFRLWHIKGARPYKHESVSLKGY
jgi:3',5'-cyclic AMP phosphodiesterase CpdA